MNNTQEQQVPNGLVYPPIIGVKREREEDDSLEERPSQRQKVFEEYYPDANQANYDGDSIDHITNLIYIQIANVYQDDYNGDNDVLEEPCYYMNVEGQDIWETLEHIEQDEKETQDFLRRRKWLDMYHLGKVLHQYLTDYYQRYPCGYQNLYQVTEQLHLSKLKARCAYRIYKLFREDEDLVEQVKYISVENIGELSSAEFEVLSLRVEQLREKYSLITFSR